MVWFVYVLVSDSLGATYVGVSTDVPRRLAQHNGESPGGARATRRGRPWHVAATCGPLATKSDAMQLEFRAKRERGLRRVAWIESRVG